jgi:hypothetical protein
MEPKDLFMNANRLRSTLAVALTLAFASGAALSQAAATDPARIQAAIAEAKARLKLTPEQEAQLKPLIEERSARLKAIRDQHAGDDSRRAKRAMYRDAKPVMDDYQEKVRAILTDEQEAEWEKMRSEARQRLKERYREGHDPD